MKEFINVYWMNYKDNFTISFNDEYFISVGSPTLHDKITFSNNLKNFYKIPTFCPYTLQYGNIVEVLTQDARTIYEYLCEHYYFEPVYVELEEKESYRSVNISKLENDIQKVLAEYYMQGFTNENLKYMYSDLEKVMIDLQKSGCIDDYGVTEDRDPTSPNINYIIRFRPALVDKDYCISFVVNAT